MSLTGYAATMTQDGQPVPDGAGSPFNRALSGMSSPTASGTQGCRPFGYRNKGNMAVVAKTSPSSSPPFAQQAAL